MAPPIEDRRRLFFPDRLGRQDRRAHAQFREHRAGLMPKREGMFQTWQGAGRGNAVGEVEFVHDDLRLAIPDDMAVLGQRVANVERNRHRAQPRQREQHDDKRDAVAEHHGDAIAFLDPERA